jgi:hypothetical protein
MRRAVLIMDIALIKECEGVSKQTVMIGSFIVSTVTSSAGLN